MDYQLPCTCGEYLTVTEGSAGAQVKCVCGRMVTVPSLGGLRELAGQPALQPSPETVIEQMLLAGTLPPDHRCVHCGIETNHRVMIQLECERAWRHKGSYVDKLFLWLFFTWWADAKFESTIALAADPANRPHSKRSTSSPLSVPHGHEAAGQAPL